MSRARVRKFLAFKGPNRGKFFRMTSKEARARGLARRRAFSGRMRANTLRTANMLGVELKFLDVEWSNVAINTPTAGASGEIQPTSGCTSAISVPAQGDGESQRDGRKYAIKSIWLSGAVIYTALSAQSSLQQIMPQFFALVLDTQANGATIVSENVYVSDGLEIVPSPLRNLQYSNRYKVLGTYFCPGPQLVTGNDAAGTYDVVPSGVCPVSINWKGHINVDCSGTTANVTSVTDNAVHLIGYTANSTYSPKFYGKARVRFVG